MEASVLAAGFQERKWPCPGSVHCHCLGQPPVPLSPVPLTCAPVTCATVTCALSPVPLSPVPFTCAPVTCATVTCATHLCHSVELDTWLRSHGVGAGGLRCVPKLVCMAQGVGGEFHYCREVTASAFGGFAGSEGLAEPMGTARECRRAPKALLLP